MGLVTLNFDLLTLKLVCRSHVCWAISLPILVFLALLVLDLFTMYATDRRTDGQTDGQKQRLMPPTYGRGHNKWNGMDYRVTTLSRLFTHVLLSIRII